jgi:hypothetical protein
LLFLAAAAGLLQAAAIQTAEAVATHHLAAVLLVSFTTMQVQMAHPQLVAAAVVALAFLALWLTAVVVVVLAATLMPLYLLLQARIHIQLALAALAELLAAMDMLVAQAALA